MKNQLNPFDVQKIQQRILPDGWMCKHLESRHSQSWLQFFQQRPIATFGLLLAFGALFSSSFLDGYSFLLKTSLTGVPNVEWVGTTMPIQRVAHKPRLTEAERRMHIDQLPENKITTLPPYDINLFQRGRVWKATNESERLAYTVWSVPNSGNYMLDGTENSGSHAGVDIVTNMGTEVYAMASGIVTKAENAPSGFGKYIVLTHPNVPDPDRPGATTTLRSVYAHLSEQTVSIGQTVTKGQLIGKVGDTGTATVAHLHWQVEKLSAPFSPYWPFNWSDMQAAGINSYFDAVSRGLNKSNVSAHTVHPVNYVRQHRNTAVATAGAIDSSRPSDNSFTGLGTGYSPIEVDVVTNNPSTMGAEFIGTTSFQSGALNTYTLRIPASPSIGQGISLSSTLGNLLQFDPPVLLAQNFNGNEAIFTVTGNTNMSFRIIASGVFGTRQSQVIKSVQEVNAVQINVSSKNTFFVDVISTHPYADEIEASVSSGIINGYADGSFRPEGMINRAEALHILMKANGISQSEQPVSFPDVPNGTWFAPAVSAAVRKGIVRGYDDGTFGPEKNVTRAEFLKMAILAAGKKPIETITDVALDVPSSAWFAPYFAYAKGFSILPNSSISFMRPNEPLTRGESVYILQQIAK